jgi:hypothetical protein
MRSVYCNMGLICITAATIIIFLLIHGVNIQAQQQQQQQPITEAIRQNSEVSAVTVANENATSVSLISKASADCPSSVYDRIAIPHACCLEIHPAVS